MIREDRLLISRHPYAVDLASLRGVMHDKGPRSIYRGSIRAVWFKRYLSVTAAHVGRLWDFQDREPADAVEFLRRHDWGRYGRYGGVCEGRWDGHTYSGTDDPEEAAQHLVLLRPMLLNYPACPLGWDGWWRF